MPDRSRLRNAFVMTPMILACLLLVAGAWSAEKSVHAWEVFEVSLTAQKELPNGYVEGLAEGGEPYAQVAFEGVSGAAKGRKCVVRAFWDGGRGWKARFAPPAAGEWSYESQSKADAGLNGASGKLSCTEWNAAEKQANPARRGFVRVAAGGPRAGRYFEYADGTPFLWIGDTWWDWSKPGIKFESFKKLADDRAAKGFSVGQLRFNSGAMLDRTKTQPNLEEIRRVERLIEYANSKGITVWIQAWWGGEELKRVGAENMRRWWRYVVRRLGAYNVVWVLAGEYNMDDYSGLGLPFWKDLVETIRREDGGGHLVSAHPTPPTWDRGMAAPQWSTAEVDVMREALDFNQSQVGHARWANEMIPIVVSEAYAKAPAKPIVVTEPWYEFTTASTPAEDIRFGAWSAVLSGAAGHSYGGGHVWWAHTPEAPTHQGSWPLEASFAVNTLDYPGAQGMAVMAKFLRGTQWWRLEPHPELLAETPSEFCAAEPGREYVVYLRWGGQVKVDLRPSSEQDQFDVVWIDAASGKERRKGSAQGGAVRLFAAPGRGGEDRFKPQDWVLWVRKKES